MDLWEVTGGGCKVKLGRGSPVAVRAEVTDDGIRLSHVGTDSAARPLNGGAVEVEERRRCCCARRRRGEGPLRILRYADLLSATVQSEASNTPLTVRLVHCPKPAGKPDAKRCRDDVELLVYPSSCPDVEAQPSSLQERAQAWASAATRKCLPERNSSGPRKFLIFVNPASGRGAAQRLWHSARDIWDAMGEQLISYTEVVTTHQGHAKTYVQESDNLHDFDGIVIVSGDGLVHEVVNGLALRPDANKALAIPLGHVPGGSGNGLATTILRAAGESYGVLDAAFVIAKGEVTPINLMQVMQNDRPPCTSFLTLSGAIIGAIDIESEKLRCIGGMRFAVWALYRCIRQRPLKAQLTYWPAEVTESPPTAAPLLDQPLDAVHWKTIEDEFSVFWGSNVAWASYDLCPAPSAQMHDGIWYLVILRKSAPRSALFRFLLALQTGAHVDHAHIEMIPCKAFRLLPQLDRGYLSLDGELVPFGPIQVWPSPHQGRVLGGSAP